MPLSAGCSIKSKMIKTKKKSILHQTRQNPTQPRPFARGSTDSLAFCMPILIFGMMAERLKLHTLSKIPHFRDKHDQSPTKLEKENQLFCYFL